VASTETLRAYAPAVTADRVVVAAKDVTRVYGEGETAAHALPTWRTMPSMASEQVGRWRV
jgi:hypothetical protein